MRWLILAFVTALPIAAHAESVSVSADDCRKLVAHVPSADVEYKPGVDVHGNAVAPADLGGGYQNIVPKEITINVGTGLASRLAQAHASGEAATTGNRSQLPYRGGAILGQLTVSGNEVLWNGQPLQPQDQAALAAACRANGVKADPASP